MVTIRKKVIFLVLIVSVACYFYLSIKPRKRASELLKDLFDYTEQLKTAQSEIQEFLVENTFDQLVAEHVKPAADKIASARKQTEIYEGMARIPGGPTDFMSKSLAILEKIQTDLYGWEREYRLATARIHRYWPKLLEKEYEATQRLQFFDSDDFYQPLEAFQLYFQIMDFEDEDRNKRKQLAVKRPKSLNQILAIVKKEVIPLVEEYEQLKIEEGKPPTFDMTDVPNPRYLEILQKLMQVIEKYDAYFQTVTTHWLKMIDEMKKITEKAINTAKYSKERYEELAVGLDDTITNLKDRIKNLKYAKTKYNEL